MNKLLTSSLVLSLAILIDASYFQTNDAPQHPGHDAHSAFCSRDLSTLRQVIMVFRYGDITPVTTFPTDIYQEDSWPNGFGQLTQRGIERSYELGQWARSCYDSFFHKHLSPRRVYVRSSDYDRTLMSAQAVVAGLYPPVSSSLNANQKWGETCAYKLGQYWQPFPIHSVPAKYDRLLRGNLNCPRFDELTKEIDFSKKARKLLGAHKKFLEKLAHKSGIKTDDLVKVVSIVESAVLTEVENGRVPVEWLNNESDLDRLAYFRDLIVSLYFENSELTKLVSGKIIQEILDRLHARAEKKSSLENIMYSAHSTVMEGLLASLGALDAIGHREPPYGSAIIFELHKMDGQYGVAVYYRNSSTHDPIALNVPGCDCKEERKEESEDSTGESESISDIGAAEPTFLANKAAAPAAVPADPAVAATGAVAAAGGVKTRVRREANHLVMWKGRRHGKKQGKKERRNKHRSSSKKVTVRKTVTIFQEFERKQQPKRRLTVCKLKDFKKAMADKTSRTHDLDCRAREKKIEKSESSSYSVSIETSRAQPDNIGKKL